MSSNKNYTIEELEKKKELARQREAAAEARRKRAAAKQRQLEKRIALQTRNELDARLRHRGEMLESRIDHADQMTDPQLNELLDIAFCQDAVLKHLKLLLPHPDDTPES